jgi:hypothetical protein
MQKIDHGVWYCNSFTRGLSSQDRVVAAHVQNLRWHGAASAEAHFGAGVLLEDGRRDDRGAGLVALVLDVLACEAARLLVVSGHGWHLRDDIVTSRALQEIRVLRHAVLFLKLALFNSVGLLVDP